MVLRRVLRAVFSILRFLWRQWPLVTALWFLCAIWVTHALKAAKHKGFFSVVGNGVLSVGFVAPFALLTVESGQSSTYKIRAASLTGLRRHLPLVLLVCAFTGLNRSLTNATLYFIDAWLKTALLALSVPLTFVFGAFVPGVDYRARRLLVPCAKRDDPSREITSWKSTLAMVPALLLISVGGIITALPNDPGQQAGNSESQLWGSQTSWAAYVFGVGLQMLSNCAGAAQNVFTKVLLGTSSAGCRAARNNEGQNLRSELLCSSEHGDTRVGEIPDSSSGAREVVALSSAALESPVTKAQIALLTQPFIAVMGFFSVIFFEHGDFTPPPLSSLVLFSIGVTGILVCELRLVELTSGLTLAVLAAAHNVIMVFFFLIFDGEGSDISMKQVLGYTVSTAGVFGYAAVRHWQNLEDAQLSA